MKNVKPHIVQNGDSFESICQNYNTTKETILLLNPICKYRFPTIGQIIYIPTDVKEMMRVEKDNEYTNLLKKTNYLYRDVIISYVNKFNDHQLIEQALFLQYQKISVFVFKEDKNNSDVFSSLLNNFHKSFYNFIDKLNSKNETEITEAKKEIQQNFVTITKFLQNQKIDFKIEEFSQIVEYKMLLVVKVINNNYYDVWKMIEA